MVPRVTRVPLFGGVCLLMMSFWRFWPGSMSNSSVVVAARDGVRVRSGGHPGLLARVRVAGGVVEAAVHDRHAGVDVDPQVLPEVAHHAQPVHGRVEVDAEVDAVEGHRGTIGAVRQRGDQGGGAERADRVGGAVLDPVDARLVGDPVDLTVHRAEVDPDDVLTLLEPDDRGRTDDRSRVRPGGLEQGVVDVHREHVTDVVGERRARGGEHGTGHDPAGEEGRGGATDEHGGPRVGDVWVRWSLLCSPPYPHLLPDVS